MTNPHSNARAGLKQVKHIMPDNVSTTGSLHEDALAKAILMYRNTPCLFTGASPAMLLFGRPVRDMIPTLVSSFSLHHSRKELLHHCERALKERICCGHESSSDHIRPLPPLKVGDTCYIQNQTGYYPCRFNKTGRVVEILQQDQYK